jgi:cytochrome c peroxidase
MATRRTALLFALLPALCGLACDRKAPSEATSEKATTEKSGAGAVAPAAPDPVAALERMQLPTLGAVPIPADRPQTEAKIELGRQLFFDTRLSVDGSRSCYSCHQNEQGTGGSTPLAIGAGDKPLPRHSPVLWNVAYLPALYWDGRADSLEAQAKAAWAGGNMGVGKDKLDAKAQEIGKVAEYAKAFKEAFPERGVTPDTIVEALSAYERTLVCNDTAYDRYASGDKNALTVEQKQGLALFMGKAGCATCHAPPHFTTAALGQGVFFNTGVGYAGKKPEEVDVGRKQVTGQDADMGSFKPPTLRNVTRTAPYFHDGSAPTLEAAVRFMAEGGHDNPNKTPLLADRKLSDAELGQLLAFLGALECGGRLEAPELPK